MLSQLECQKVHHLTKAGLVMEKLCAVLGAMLHRGATTTEELAQQSADIQLWPTLRPVTLISSCRCLHP